MRITIVISNFKGCLIKRLLFILHHLHDYAARQLETDRVDFFEDKIEVENIFGKSALLLLI